MPKITQLPSVLASLTTDIFPVVQGGVTSQETIAQLVALLNNSTVLTGYVPIAGGTMSGPLILSGSPTLPNGAADKAYVDQFASGLHVILACVCATTANLNVTPAGAGVGATLTDASGTFAAFTTDGVSPAVGSRVLVKNQTLSQHNGIYNLTTNGDTISIPYVLTRSTDYDTNTEIVAGTLVPVELGTVNATSSWLETDNPTVIDTDPIQFTQFTFGPSTFLLKANNLSDLPSVPTALVNLGLGVPTGTGNVVLQTSPTLITPILGVATATSLQFSPSTNGIIGTVTNDNATAGRVGEFITSNITFAAGLNMPSNVIIDITTLALTAGDWDLYGNVFFNNTVSTVGTFRCWISTVSATQPDFSEVAQIAISGNALDGCSIVCPIIRVSIAGPTTVFLTARAIFLAGTCKGSGTLSARRVR